MSHVISRADVEVFYHALAERNYQTVYRYLADDVQWIIGGPVDLIPFCGVYQGKAAVIDLHERKMPAVQQARRFVPDMMLVDGNCAAVLAQVSAKKLDNGDSINYRAAQFFTFCDGKLIRFRSVIDSFDAAEQVTGRRIDVGSNLTPENSTEELFAV